MDAFFWNKRSCLCHSHTKDFYWFAYRMHPISVEIFPEYVMKKHQSKIHVFENIEVPGEEIRQKKKFLLLFSLSLHQTKIIDSTALEIHTQCDHENQWFSCFQMCPKVCTGQNIVYSRWVLYPLQNHACELAAHEILVFGIFIGIVTLIVNFLYFNGEWFSIRSEGEKHIKENKILGKWIFL